jgi:hypothetical protein
MSRRWAEIHDFTELQNSRSKITSNPRSFLLSLPITLFLAVLISLGGWLWLLRPARSKVVAIVAPLLRSVALTHWTVRVQCVVDSHD